MPLGFALVFFDLAARFGAAPKEWREGLAHVALSSWFRGTAAPSAGRSRFANANQECFPIPEVQCLSFTEFLQPALKVASRRRKGERERRAARRAWRRE